MRNLLVASLVSILMACTPDGTTPGTDSGAADAGVADGGDAARSIDAGAMHDAFTPVGDAGVDASVVLNDAGADASSSDAATTDAFIVLDDAGVDAGGLDAGLPESACADGLDNDGDGATDCLDSDCLTARVCSGHIQLIQDGTVATGSVVDIADVFVTGVHGASGANVFFFVQEADGVTSPGHAYPEYAGVEVFVRAADTAAFADLAGLAVGDCVSLTGTTSELVGAITEIINLSAFTRAASSLACGTFPTPLVVPSVGVSLADVATDTGSLIAGPRSETYEDILMTLENVTAISPGVDDTTSFRLTPTGGPSTPYVRANSFLYSYSLPVAGQTYSRLTGVYTQANLGGMAPFVIMPRSAADTM